MRFLHTMVRITDLDASMRFYCEGLGLKQVARKDNEGGRFSLLFLASPLDIENANVGDDENAFAVGLPMLELTYNWPPEDGVGEVYDGGRNFGHLAYRVENIYELCAHLMDMGYVINRPPRDGHMAFVRSPDGISVELLQAGERLAPVSPWAEMKNIGAW